MLAAELRDAVERGLVYSGLDETVTQAFREIRAILCQHARATSQRGLA